jgi:hypothetical protein
MALAAYSTAAAQRNWVTDPAWVPIVGMKKTTQWILGLSVFALPTLAWAGESLLGGGGCGCGCPWCG